MHKQILPSAVALADERTVPELLHQERVHTLCSMSRLQHLHVVLHVHAMKSQASGSVLPLLCVHHEERQLAAVGNASDITERSDVAQTVQ